MTGYNIYNNAASRSKRVSGSFKVDFQPNPNLTLTLT